MNGSLKVLGSVAFALFAAVLVCALMMVVAFVATVVIVGIPKHGNDEPDPITTVGMPMVIERECTFEYTNQDAGYEVNVMTAAGVFGPTYGPIKPNETKKISIWMSSYSSKIFTVERTGYGETIGTIKVTRHDDLKLDVEFTPVPADQLKDRSL